MTVANSTTMPLGRDFLSNSAIQKPARSAGVSRWNHSDLNEDAIRAEAPTILLETLKDL